MFPTMMLAVQITDEDIDKGIQGDCHFCAGALAVRRALRNRGYSDAGVTVYGGVCVPERHLSAENEALHEWQRGFDSWKDSETISWRPKKPRPKPAEFMLEFC